MSSVDFDEPGRSFSAELESPDIPMPLTDDPPGSSSPMHQTVPGIDVTGATISQEWSVVAETSAEGGLYGKILKFGQTPRPPSEKLFAHYL